MGPYILQLCMGLSYFWRGLTLPYFAHCTTTYIVTPWYRSENSCLNSIFRVGLHSVYKRVFWQSWLQSSAADGASKCRRCRRARVTDPTH